MNEKARENQRTYITPPPSNDMPVYLIEAFTYLNMYKVSHHYQIFKVVHHGDGAVTSR